MRSARHVALMRQIRYAYKILGGKHEKKRPLGTSIIGVDGR
jgi:hypothetical protein